QPPAGGAGGATDHRRGPSRAGGAAVDQATGRVRRHLRRQERPLLLARPGATAGPQRLRRLGRDVPARTGARTVDRDRAPPPSDVAAVPRLRAKVCCPQRLVTGHGRMILNGEDLRVSVELPQVPYSHRRSSCPTLTQL